MKQPIDLEGIRAEYDAWKRWEAAMHGGTGAAIIQDSEAHMEFGRWLIDGFPALLDEIARLRKQRDALLFGPPNVMTSTIGNLTIDSDGMRKAVGEIARLQEFSQARIRHLDEAFQEINRLQGLLDRAVEDLRNKPAACAHRANCKCISAFNGRPDCDYCEEWQWRGFSEREGG